MHMLASASSIYLLVSFCVANSHSQVPVLRDATSFSTQGRARSVESGLDIRGAAAPAEAQSSSILRRRATDGTTSTYAQDPFDTAVSSRRNGGYGARKDSFASSRSRHSYQSGLSRDLSRSSSLDSEDSDWSDDRESFRREDEEHQDLARKRRARMHLAAQSTLGGIGVVGFGAAAGLGIAAYKKKRQCEKANPQNKNCGKGWFHHRRGLGDMENPSESATGPKLRRRDSISRSSRPLRKRQLVTRNDDKTQKPPHSTNGQGLYDRHVASQGRQSSDPTNYRTAYEESQPSRTSSRQQHDRTASGAFESLAQAQAGNGNHHRQLSGRPSTAFEGDYPLHQHSGPTGGSLSPIKSEASSRSPRSSITTSGSSYYSGSRSTGSLTDASTSYTTGDSGRSYSRNSRSRAVQHPLAALDWRKRPWAITGIALGSSAAATGIVLWVLPFIAWLSIRDEAPTLRLPHGSLCTLLHLQFTGVKRC